MDNDGPSNTNAVANVEHGEVQQFDPHKTLQSIYLAENAQHALEKKLRNHPDDPFVRGELRDVITTKIHKQAEYSVMRPEIIQPSQTDPRLRGKREAGVATAPPPPYDPGKDTIKRWRKAYCEKVSVNEWKFDPVKEAEAVEDSWHRSVRICEAQKDGTVRGTEGTGEFLLYTPAKYIEAVRMVFDGEIDLDPATDDQGQETVNAKYFLTEEDNGLTHEWHGKVFLNPPYSKTLAPEFINKLVAEYQAGRTTAAILLINNVTDTEMFDAVAQAASSFCFTYGRISFLKARLESGAMPEKPVAPTQGQVFVYLGEDAQRFEDVFCMIGGCVRRSRDYEGPREGDDNDD